MKIQNMIESIEMQLTQEQDFLKEQQKLVNDLSAQYADEMAILKVLRLRVQTLNNSLAELKSVNSSKGKKQSVLNEKSFTDSFKHDENYLELTSLLEEAADICISKGVFVEIVTKKDGNIANNKQSLVNRAKCNIIRRCPDTASSYTEWVRGLTDDYISGMRDIGKKSGEIIKTARNILLGVPV